MGTLYDVYKRQLMKLLCFSSYAKLTVGVSHLALVVKLPSSKKERNPGYFDVTFSK